MKIYLDKIYVIENFITKDECQYLLNKFNENTYDTPEHNIKSGFSLSGDKMLEYCNSGKEDLENKIFNRISTTLSDFYKDEIELKSIFHSIMTKGSKNPPHWDNYVEDGEDDISNLLYLNKEFKGGSLRFIDQNIEIKPLPGMFIFFKGEESLIHEVTEVTEGSRQALVGFSWPQRKRISVSSA
jgi:Rps23 Pro-64 3,4-dihydroxylase Tpa1-like proline 4-hydroxylase